jgi:hypothetical protein
LFLVCRGSLANLQSLYLLPPLSPDNSLAALANLWNYGIASMCPQFIIPSTLPPARYVSQSWILIRTQLSIRVGRHYSHSLLFASHLTEFSLLLDFCCILSRWALTIDIDILLV